MALIAPFRALRYDPSRVKPAEVVTQPYDKITPALQDRYYSASPHNLVRIILGRKDPDDTPQSSVYTRAAGFFQDWRRQGIFLQDAQPAIYPYTQTFEAPGGYGRQERRGFIALGRLEDYSAGVVFRHEQTLARPKADRLDLLRATRAHFGQLFMLYSGAGELDSLLQTASAPILEVEDEYGVQHRTWKLSDPSLIEMVRTQMRDQRLIIADGHHRYETALAYRDERRASAPTAVIAVPRQKTGERWLPAAEELAPYEMVMMTFINMDSPGLVILPTHRVLHSLPSFSPEQFLARAGAYFNIEQVEPGLDADRARGLLRSASRAGVALLGVCASQAFLFHTPKAAGAEIFSGYSFQQQNLDVVQLHRCLLEGALGLTEESIRQQQNLAYVRDAAEGLERVRSGQSNIVFLMNPCRMEQVRNIAFAGEVLPQKSTDFYPKLLTGLTIYALD